MISLLPAMGATRREGDGQQHGGQHEAEHDETDRHRRMRHGGEAREP